jgi:hypothetical protein
LTKRINFRLVGAALLPAVAVSVALLLVGKALDLPESLAERASQIVFFPLFFAACHAWRRRFDRGARPQRGA